MTYDDQLEHSIVVLELEANLLKTWQDLLSIFKWHYCRSTWAWNPWPEKYSNEVLASLLEYEWKFHVEQSFSPWKLLSTYERTWLLAAASAAEHRVPKSVSSAIFKLLQFLHYLHFLKVSNEVNELWFEEKYSKEKDSNTIDDVTNYLGNVTTYIFCTSILVILDNCA